MRLARLGKLTTATARGEERPSYAMDKQGLQLDELSFLEDSQGVGLG